MRLKNPITIKEHESLKENEKYLNLTDEEKENIKKIPKNFNLIDENYKASYYIGTDWLIENELALLVTPKINNLDYLTMFIDCLNNPTVAYELNKKRHDKSIYKIHLEKEAIPLENNPFEITPLLIVHFIKLVEQIVKRGLKRDYVRIHKNLSSKIKGKIMFAQHLKKNVMQGRADRVFCNFGEYLVDCPENQLLKKALLFCQSYLTGKLTSAQKETFQKINQKFCLVKNAFSQVSDLKHTAQLKHFKVNKLYRGYDETLKIAQMILKRFGYNIQKTQQQEANIPPFWIDMSLLFELFVLGKLKKAYGDEIDYQVTTKGNEVDFIKKGDEKIIIDAKYKSAYIDGGFNIDDIRQLSGYARDTKILEKLGVDDGTVVDCLIIYPKKEGIKEFVKDENLLSEKNKKEEINQFTKFYKIGMALPVQKSTKIAP